MAPPSKANISPHRLLVLQEETLALRALESQGYGDIFVQAEAFEVGRQRALEVELCFTDHLSGRNVPLSAPNVVRLRCEYQESTIPGTVRDSLY